MTEFPQLNLGLVVPVFTQGDDPIACLNKAMAFLSAVATSRRQGYWQQVQWRQGQSYAGTDNKGNATSSGGNNAIGQARVMAIFIKVKDTWLGNALSLKGQETPHGLRTRQCWLKHGSGQILNEEQLAFFADPSILDGQAAQTTILNNVAFQTEYLDAYDVDYDDVSTAKAVLMANLSNYGYDVISEVPHSKPCHNDMDNQSVHAMQDFEQTPVVDFLDNKITSDSNIIPYSQYLQETQQAAIQDTNLIEAPSELPKVSLVDTSLKKLKFYLSKFDAVVKKHITPDAITEGEWEFEHTKAVFLNEIIPFLKTLKEIFDVFDKDLLNELQAKDTTIRKLKDHIKSMRENDKEEKVKQDMDEIETIHTEQEHNQFDSIKKTHVRTKEHSESLISQLNSKSIENADLKAQIQDKVVQIVLCYLDSECSKHMTRNRSQLMNFVNKFLGTVRIENDHIAKIMGYGDYQLRNVTISTVYYVEGLGHNLFSVRQFCDSDLDVAFWKNICFIRDLDSVDLVSGSRDTNLYTIYLDDMLKTSPIYLLSKALNTKSWLWHCQLSHLNFGTLNKLAKYDLARGIPTLKYKKDHLCSAYALGKSKKSSHQPKAEDTNQEKLYLLHMDLCCLIHVESINGKKYILVIVYDYLRFTWVKFLRSKDDAPDAIIKCIKNIQVHLNATVHNVRTYNGTEFVNRTLQDFYENVGI
ncbi:retrovirus-related pol polyprotein from transposon TNT 1-94 [Tanacetum coccineum]